MDTLSAFAMGIANRGKEMKVFDWDKAATLIKKALEEGKSVYAEAGLSQDWEYTGGVIFEDGKPTPKDESYTYLASTWATPELSIDGDVVDCFVMESQTSWSDDTFWPDSALRILED